MPEIPEPNQTPLNPLARVLSSDACDFGPSDASDPYIQRLKDEHAKLLLFLESFLITFDIVPVDIPCHASKNLITQGRELLESISQPQ